MKPLHLLAVLVTALSVLGCEPARACHSEEATAGLCGSVREPEPAPVAPLGCGPGEETVCIGRLQRIRESALLIGRYTALGRAGLDGSATRR